MLRLSVVRQHPAGGRAVAGSNPVSPTRRSRAFTGAFAAKTTAVVEPAGNKRATNPRPGHGALSARHEPHGDPERLAPLSSALDRDAHPRSTGCATFWPWHLEWFAHGWTKLLSEVLAS